MRAWWRKWVWVRRPAAAFMFERILLTLVEQIMLWDEVREPVRPEPRPMRGLMGILGS